MQKVVPIAKKALRICLIALECFFGFICFYIVFALFGMIFSCGEFDSKEEVTLYIRSNGVHTDICMPTSTAQKDWLASINLEDYEDQNHLEYIAIGWGDKGFFLDTPTWAELKASTAVNAVFLPSPTAMHVEFLAEPQNSETIREVKISRKAYARLIRFVESTFILRNNRPILIPNHGYGLTDNFYEANGSYHLFNTCNVWTNDAMKSASIPTSIFSIFPDGNLMHLSK
jgi:uncharacterized protein (TIGR02117 family)